VELREFKRILQQVMSLPIAALLLMAAILSYEIYTAQRTVAAIERSDSRIALSHLLQRLVVDEETAVRGYQITGDTRFIAPYRDAKAPLDQVTAELLSTYNSGNSSELQSFIAEHQAWDSLFARPIIAAVAAGQSTNDDDINLTGRVRIESMRRSLNHISDSSERNRVAAIEKFHRQIRSIIIVLLLVAFGTGIFLALLLRDRFEVVSASFQRSLDLERRRAEELYDSEQRLRTTLASIGDGVISCDAEGHVETMNPVAEQLTGWTETEASGRPVEEIFPVINETTRERVDDPFTKVKRLNRIVTLANHTVLLRKDGTEIPIDDSGAPILNASGELSGVVTVFRDITAARRTRATLLANEKLAVAGRLAATIAHEIHNPLDSVTNILYLLQQGTTAEEAGHFLELAQSELARVTQISRAMLSLYRESKAPVPIDLKDALQDLLILLDHRFQEIGVQVSSELPGGITVDGFPAELRQVFTNLITNAAEAAGPGGKVHVRLLDKSDSRDIPPRGDLRPAPGAIVEISDSGPGISADVADRLFEPFVTTKGERGTGLGLWVSQGIIRKHGGNIHLRNREDGEHQGAIATIFLARKPTILPGVS
jgi:PAS domain S-box-containing protein